MGASWHRDKRPAGDGGAGAALLPVDAAGCDSPIPLRRAAEIIDLRRRAAHQEGMTGIPFPDLSPDIVTLSLAGFSFTLRWYALAYIAGILLGWLLIRAALRRPRLWRDDQPPMSVAQLENLMTWIIIGVILGGRLGYVLFYQAGNYLADPMAIFRIWEGGMSFHGGFLGVVVAVLGFCRVNKVALAPVADAVAMVAPIGLLLGRLANFVNAELWGRPTTLPWGVIFPGEAAQQCSGVQPMGLCARHPSQLYEAGLEGLLLGALLLALAFGYGALKKPWHLTGLFLIGYGLARFVVEFVRQPDAQFQSFENPLGLAWHWGGGMGLTMGQMLSLPMILAGLALIALRLRR